MPGGMSIPKWLNLANPPQYLPKEVHELKGFTAFHDWMFGQRYLGSDGTKFVKEQTLQACLGIGLLLREISLINDTEEGDFPEGSPQYLNSSRLGMEQYESTQLLAQEMLDAVLATRKFWRKKARYVSTVFMVLILSEKV